MLLTYTMPLSPRGISGEKVGVLSTVQYGGRYWARTSDLCDDMSVVLFVNRRISYAPFEHPSLGTAFLLFANESLL